MRSSNSVIAFLSGVLTSCLALSIATPTPQPDHYPTKCTNAESRLCWDGKYDINTNYYTSGPRTGKTVKYYLELKNVTLSPDGIPAQFLTINGTVPGPTLIANWGDTIEVHVTNKMHDNGTSIHWHGVRQLHTNKYDGANGVTECPLAPGDTKVYRFIAEQYGTSWYHSHYSVQYGDGAWGAIQINGPATAEYDIDLGTITLSEIYNQTAFQTGEISQTIEPPQPIPARNILINGTNVNVQNPSLGKRFQATFTKGKKHRLRFINTAADTVWRVAVDFHKMKVIQSDFVPIHPYTADYIDIAIGQRYDVIIDADQDVGSYWLRAIVQINCGETNDNTPEQNLTGFISYKGYKGLPAKSAPLPPANQDCHDETQLVPYVPIKVPQTHFGSSDKSVVSMNVSGPVSDVNDLGDTVTRWRIHGGSIDVDWTNPTLLQLKNNKRTKPSNPIFLDKAGYTYWIIENEFVANHPIHLHGHDFNIISQSAANAGPFDPSKAILNWNNPPRRDVATLPGNGSLVIAFNLDNPGAWLLHCHIAWHVAQGLSVQLIERQQEIFKYTTLDSAWEKTCTNFKKWYPTAIYGPKDDSGI